MEQEGEIKDEVFAAELEKYENKWVAITNYGGDSEAVVGSGDSIREARLKAESNGFKDVTFFKVPPSNRLFVPATYGLGMCVI